MVLFWIDAVAFRIIARKELCESSAVGLDHNQTDHRMLFKRLLLLAGSP